MTITNFRDPHQAALLRTYKSLKLQTTNKFRAKPNMHNYAPNIARDNC